jgi:hypothetical protein
MFIDGKLYKNKTYVKNKNKNLFLFWLKIFIEFVTQHNFEK